MPFHFREYLALGLSGLATIAAAIYLASQGFECVKVAFSSLALFLLLTPFFLLSEVRIASLMGQFVGLHPRRLAMIAAILLIPYFIFALGTNSFSWASLVLLITFLLAPLLSSLFAHKFHKDRFGIFDLVSIFFIWIPFDTGMIPDIWLWPPSGEAAYSLNAVLAVIYAIALFQGFRSIKGIGYRASFSTSDLKIFLQNFSLFFPLAIAFGIGTGFIHYNGNLNPLPACGMFVGIFLFIAIPEELLFRGLLQNYLTRRIANPTAALIVTSIIFGLTHLNNDPLYDWRYVTLASLAGFFYGRAYQKSRGLLVPALIHATVDAIWVHYFR